MRVNGTSNFWYDDRKPMSCADCIASIKLRLKTVSGGRGESSYSIIHCYMPTILVTGRATKQLISTCLLNLHQRLLLQCPRFSVKQFQKLIKCQRAQSSDRVISQSAGSSDLFRFLSRGSAPDTV